MFDFLGKMKRTQWNGFVDFIEDETNHKNVGQLNNLNARKLRMQKLQTRLAKKIGALNDNLEEAVRMPTEVATTAPAGVASGSGDRIIDTNISIPFDKMHEVVRPTIKELYERWEFMNKRCCYAIWRLEEQYRKRDDFENVGDVKGTRDTIIAKIEGYWGLPAYGDVLEDDIIKPR